MTDEYSDALERIFEGRSRRKWSDKAVPQQLIHGLYNLVQLGPTSMNSLPARFLFLVSPEARDRFALHAKGANQARVRNAPCVAIVAYDEQFHEQLPKLYPSRPELRELYVDDAQLTYETAFRNSTLQGAYLMVAARLLGLDCGPMSGFSHEGVDNEFFAGTRLKSNFACALGYAIDEPYPRLPRFTFDEAAQIL